jgi:hyperosmotically inducible periplasmic protein
MSVMIQKLLIFCFPLFIAGLLAAGCNQANNQQANDEKPSNATGSNTNAASDAEITAAVKAKFMTDKDVSARKIDVETNEGVVTLRGTVGSEQEAVKAQELAKSADGVRMVHSYLRTDISENNEDTGSVNKTLDKAENKLEKGVNDVADAGSDAAITAQIKWKLAKDKLVQASDIDVDTKDRHVTLTGTVNSKQEKDRAIQLARSVDDVASVRSDLQIR